MYDTKIKVNWDKAKIQFKEIFGLGIIYKL